MKFKLKQDHIIIGIIALTGLLVHKFNTLRSVSGFDSWYSDANLITMAQVVDTLFFGLISGFVIAKILKKW